MQEKALKRAFYEKSRYYANRIAQNEVMKAYSIKRAKMIADDDSIEVVKVRMSRTHPRKDICDYHASIDKYGLGKGVYPKGKAPIPTFHPFCRCRLIEDDTLSAKGAEFNPKADREFIDKLGNYEKSLILGSKRRVDMFAKSGDVMKSAVLNAPMYLGDVDRAVALGYNVGMEKFSKNIITNTEAASIIKWTEDSTLIKQSMWGLNSDPISIKHANVLFGLFDKYKTNVPLGKNLYRGMSVPDALFGAMGYDMLKKGSEYTPDNLAITSFSSSNRIAYEFAKDGEYTNNIILKVEAHGADMLDISDISTVAKEEETILMKIYGIMLSI